MKRIEVISFFNGFFYMVVCAEKDATDEEILEVCNRENPSGTSAGWCSVIRNSELSGQNPLVCNEDENRLHIMVSC